MVPPKKDLELIIMCTSNHVLYCMRTMISAWCTKHLAMSDKNGLAVKPAS